MKRVKLIYLLFLILFIYSCQTNPGNNSLPLKKKPLIEPDYIGISIPQNIAPLNFSIKEEGEQFYIKIDGENDMSLLIKSKNGIVKLPQKKWKRLLKQNSSKQLNYNIFVKRENKWYKFETFNQKVIGDSIDPYIYYRLLYPGYESWNEISIMQRHLESFIEKTVIKNNVLDQNCINCHAFNQQKSGDFLFHVRGSLGGTYFLENDNLKRINLKTEKIQNGAVYPRWHPSGKFVAFSSNKVIQQFHSSDIKKIEVSDLHSSLILYDINRNELMEINPEGNADYMDTYPEWSPCGKYLYFCRAKQIEEYFDYEKIKYDLYRMEFQQENMIFKEPQLIFNASALNKSASFPRISPNGKKLVFTLHDYGCFPIWHKEADLYVINISDLSLEKLTVNSNFSESYHSWSSNGRWLLFSSKRGDGLSARPYIAYFTLSGQTGKPFVVPQKDPVFYRRFMKTYNIPEFATYAVSFRPGELRKAAKSKPVQAMQVN
jgi:hypothetical protein